MRRRLDQPVGYGKAELKHTPNDPALLLSMAEATVRYHRMRGEGKLWPASSTFRSMRFPAQHHMGRVAVSSIAIDQLQVVHLNRKNAVLRVDLFLVESVWCHRKAIQ